ncbi:MAG: hypothetical protein MJK06_14805 [Hyphomicrobiales bacterium]|nr:hypothetical protein [Hyphomicrobiales bacterium]
MNVNPITVSVACIAIGFINVLLNIFIKRAADQPGGFWSNISSITFVMAFLVGTLSLVSIFSLYSLKVDLGRAILLMGAASIVGGSVIAIILFDADFSSLEFVILALIAVFYIIRLFNA